MQAPKRKKSPSCRNMRRSHDALKPRRIGKCSSCGEPVRSHHVCGACGNYRGRQLIKVAANS